MIYFKIPTLTLTYTFLAISGQRQEGTNFKAWDFIVHDIFMLYRVGETMMSPTQLSMLLQYLGYGLIDFSQIKFFLVYYKADSYYDSKKIFKRSCGHQYFNIITILDKVIVVRGPIFLLVNLNFLLWFVEQFILKILDYLD